MLCPLVLHHSSDPTLLVWVIHPSTLLVADVLFDFGVSLFMMSVWTVLFLTGMNRGGMLEEMLCATVILQQH